MRIILERMDEFSSESIKGIHPNAGIDVHGSQPVKGILAVHFLPDYQVKL